MQVILFFKQLCNGNSVGNIVEENSASSS